MKSELERLAERHQKEDCPDSYADSFIAGAKAVLEFARSESYPIDASGNFRVTLQDLEKFIEGEICNINSSQKKSES